MDLSHEFRPAATRSLRRLANHAAVGARKGVHHEVPVDVRLIVALGIRRSAGRGGRYTVP